MPTQKVIAGETHPANHFDGAAGGLVGSLSGDLPDHRRQLSPEIQWLSHHFVRVLVGTSRRLLVRRPGGHCGLHAQTGRSLYPGIHAHFRPDGSLAGPALPETQPQTRRPVAPQSLDFTTVYRSGTGGDKGSSGDGFACSLVRAPGAGTGASRIGGTNGSRSSLCLRGLGGSAARRASTSA